ncbi:hypothetical protein H5410_028884 [Solanum commersonii]|uniref:Uncharacterized protein n=1 Tax=Solanum commersonii TaxID=4109 RepID=A0A9J5Z635_SOLCO|nr:hypothetical protein H5410_028884 [Solanum commersonii]
MLISLEKAYDKVSGGSIECMSFADKVVLIDKTHEGVSAKLESLGLSRTNTEYLECKFNEVTHEIDVEVIEGYEEIDENVNHIRMDEVDPIKNSHILEDECGGDEDDMITRKDRIKNEDIRDKVGVTSVEDEMWEVRLR